VAPRRKSRLRRALAALLLRLARRLAPPGAEPDIGNSAVAPEQAPAHWLARLRTGARRLTFRTDPSAEAALAPPEPAPRRKVPAPQTPRRVETEASDTDWRNFVRDRARELGMHEARTSRSRNAGDREQLTARAEFGTPSPRDRLPAASSRSTRTVEARPTPGVSSRERSTAPPLSAPVLRAPIAREQPTVRKAPPVRLTGLVRIEDHKHRRVQQDTHPPQTPRAPRAAVRIAAPPIPRNTVTKTREQSASAAPAMPAEPMRVVPALPRQNDVRPIANHASPAASLADSPQVETRVHRKEPPQDRGLPAHTTPPRDRMATQDEPCWPSLPGEPGDFAQVPDPWPQPPREAPESPVEYRLRERITDAAHEAFLQAEQRGDRWNA